MYSQTVAALTPSTVIGTARHDSTVALRAIGNAPMVGVRAFASGSPWPEMLYSTTMTSNPKISPMAAGIIRPRRLAA